MGLIKLFHRFKDQSHSSADRWQKARKCEIARTWHNPTHLDVTPEWRKIGNNLRAGARPRKVVTIMKEQAASGKYLVRGEFNMDQHVFIVTACLEKLKNGGTLKHAMIRIPGNQLSNDMFTVFPRIALAIEPQEPAWTGVNEDDEGQFYTLCWPTDWSRAHTDFTFQTFPMWNPPITLTQDRSLKMPAGYDERLSTSGSSRLLSVISQIAVAVVAIQEYLDLQSSQDLIFLQMARSGVTSWTLPKELGDIFPGLLDYFIRDRLGPCQKCGHVVCKDYSSDNLPTRVLDRGYEGIDKPLPGRRFKGMDIWPVSEEAAFLFFTYVCSSCQESINTDRWWIFRDQEVEMPALGNFLRPFSEFAQLR